MGWKLKSLAIEVGAFAPAAILIDVKADLTDWWGWAMLAAVILFGTVSGVIGRVEASQ